MPVPDTALTAHAHSTHSRATRIPFDRVGGRTRMSAIDHDGARRNHRSGREGGAVDQAGTTDVYIVAGDRTEQDREIADLRAIADNE